MTLKNDFGKCSLFVLSFVFFFLFFWKDQNMDSFPAKENANMEKALFDRPIVLQYDVKARYRLISREFFAHEVFQPSVRLTNQKPRAFVSVRQTNQIALFPFVCCFCFVLAFSFQGHTNIAPFFLLVEKLARNSQRPLKACSKFLLWAITSTQKQFNEPIKPQNKYNVTGIKRGWESDARWLYNQFRTKQHCKINVTRREITLGISDSVKESCRTLLKWSPSTAHIRDHSSLIRFML